jgi:RNA polymerase sigma-70 factor, ECF subfamily
MPPYAMWIQGAENIGEWMLLPGPSGCRGSRLLATSANGCPAFAQYRPDPEGGYYAFALQVLEISDGRVIGFNSFQDTERIFPAFGFPARLAE